ncbi:hypothetical protein RUM43_009230 [Polyplax serrata]|uniref:Seipin n=1 Tax=Polyplax serrata TaxID=468196 RepID=A0AAN8PHY9_POLSC
MIVGVFCSLVSGALKPFRRMMFTMPGLSYVNNRVEEIKDRSNEKIKKVKGTALRGGIFILSFSIIVWMAIFIYVAFYYTYMPALTHVRPVHVQFKTCDDAESSICSFPYAHVILTRRQQFLMVGQSYKIYLNFEMPESVANRNLGMFMVCLDLNDKDGTHVARSCRPVMLHYRSRLLHIIKTVVMAPLLVLGTAEEKQLITVEMFSDFEEDDNHPVTNMYVEIKSKKIELYSSSMHIHAHFTGLRYLMFHWPVLSAILGVGTNLFLILFVLLLSWYHLFNNESRTNYYSQVLRDKFYPLKKEDNMQKKEILELEDLSSDTNKALCPQYPKSVVKKKVFLVHI